MGVCTGFGGKGDHCCYVDGEVCDLLVFNDKGVPRCSVWGEWDSEPYLSSAVYQAYQKAWPGKGYHCGDWPQNIPDVRGGVCCWEGRL